MVWMLKLLRQWLRCFPMAPSTFIHPVQTQPSKQSLYLLVMTVVDFSDLCQQRPLYQAFPASALSSPD